MGYQAGVGKVITGWDQGCLGMKIGEERKLVIPAAEGYGAGGFPAWGIPPGAINSPKPIVGKPAHHRLLVPSHLPLSLFPMYSALIPLQSTWGKGLEVNG